MNNDIEKIQQSSFEILKLLIEFFEKYSLTYYLAGGTFLGAVRHQGFIPWDDDIDISMPRNDYEKFLTLIHSEKPDYIDVKNFKIDSSYRHFITRVLDKRYNVEEIRTKEITNPAVDIFPIDGSPNNKVKRAIYYKKIMGMRYAISLSNRDMIDMNRNRSFLEQLVVTIAKKIPFENIIDSQKIKTILEQSMTKYSMDESEYSGCLMGAYRIKEMVLTEYYGESKLYDFEGIKARGPEKSDEYLTALYGDYMKIPSKEEISDKVHYRWINK